MRAPGMCMSPRFVLELELDRGMMDGWMVAGAERRADAAARVAVAESDRIGCRRLCWLLDDRAGGWLGRTRMREQSCHGAC